MNTNTLLLALVAAFAVGCGSSTDSGTSAQTGTQGAPDTVASAAGTETAPVEGNQATAVLGAEATPADAAKPADAKPGTPPAAGSAAPSTPRAPQGGTEGVRAEQPGGPRGGAQGGRGGGRGFNIGAILRSEQLKTELKITPDQAKKLEAAMPAQGQGGGQQTSPEERAKQRAEIEAKVKAILTPAQQLRMRQIELQVRGPRALTREDVAKELKLTADQTKKIEAALEVQRPQGGQGGPGAGGGGFDREAFMKAREEANKKALAVLSAAQKAQWEKMLGEPFTMQPPQGAPGGPSATRGGGA